MINFNEYLLSKYMLKQDVDVLLEKYPDQDLSEHYPELYNLWQYLEAQVEQIKINHSADKAVLNNVIAMEHDKVLRYKRYAIQPGHTVKVNFVSESVTHYSGQRFTGTGTVDLVSEGYIYGRLENGTPFMCGFNDVELIDGP